MSKSPAPDNRASLSVRVSEHVVFLKILSLGVLVRALDLPQRFSLGPYEVSLRVLNTTLPTRIEFTVRLAGRCVISNPSSGCVHPEMFTDLCCLVDAELELLRQQRSAKLGDRPQLNRAPTVVAGLRR